MARIDLPSGNAECIVTNSAEETMQLGLLLGEKLPNNTVICLFGDLAAGKTTFVKGVVAGACRRSDIQVVSPTFVYLNIYEGQRTVYHFDLYRMQGADEFLSMGFEDTFEAGGLCCIEWSERIPSLLPPHCIHVLIEHVSEGVRQITIIPNKKCV